MSSEREATLAAHRAELNDFYGSKWAERERVTWNEIYPDWAAPYSRVYAARNREVISRVPAGTRSLLDCGCGVGDLLLALDGRVERLAGVDLADVNVTRARQNLSRSGTAAEVRLAPAEDLPFPDGSFDCVLLLDVLEHVIEREATFRELARILAPGGRLICVTPVRGTQRLLERIDLVLRAPLELARRLLGRRRHVTPEAFEEFLDAEELTGLIAASELDLGELTRICFYPGPEGGGALLTLIRVVAKLPGGMRIVTSIARLFARLERIERLNQKWLAVATKPS